MLLPVSLAGIMADPTMSLSRSPFSREPLPVVKRASFRKGVVPAHLEKYLIKKGECAGRTGVLIFKGHPVPATAVCVAEKHGK
ncbi:hypothetical protein ES705_31652 [subsurface metagenome]